MKHLIALLVLLLLSAPAGAQESEANAKVRKQMKARKISLNFNDTPIEDVVAFFRDIMGISFHLSPGADRSKTLTVQLKDISMDQALGFCLRMMGAGLIHRVACGVVLIGPKKEVAAYPAEAIAPKGLSESDQKLWDGAAKHRLSTNFRKTPIKDVLSFLEEISGTSISFDMAGKAKRTISLSLRKVSLTTVLSFIPHELGGEVQVLYERAGVVCTLDIPLEAA